MKKLHHLFVTLGAIGFAGMFFVAGASDANTITFDQIACLSSVCSVSMAIGVIGEILIGDDKNVI